MKYQYGIVALFFFSTLVSCANKVSNLTLSNDDSYFLLKENVKYGKKYLPKGMYRCYYKDINGSYYEAPSSISPSMFFSRGNAGGVYIKDSAFLEAYIYFQNKHPQSIYVDALSIFTVGGSADFKITNMLLPRDISDQIIIQ